MLLIWNNKNDLGVSDLGPVPYREPRTEGLKVQKQTLKRLTNQSGLKLFHKGQFQIPQSDSFETDSFSQDRGTVHAQQNTAQTDV